MDGYQGYGGYGAPQTPQDAKMRLAASMLQGGLSTAPIRSPWQGAAQLAQVLAGKSMLGQIGQGQAAANKTTLANSPFAAAAGGAGMVPGGMALPPGAGGAPGAPPPVAPGSGGVATGGANAPVMPPQNGGSPNGGGPFPASPPQAGGSSLPGTGAAPLNSVGATYANDQGGHAAFIRARAAALGIDPNFALSVAGAEGLRALSPQNPNGASSVDRNPDGTPFSFGDFQLNVRNGLGAEALKRGIDPRDPNQWQQADEYALETMAKQGLQPWKGDAAVNAYQKQGGGWTPPPAGGNGGGSALAFSGGGGGFPAPPAVGAINAAAGAPGGFPPPPGQGGFPPPPQAGGGASQIDPQTAQRAQALLGVALNPDASPETRQQAAQMYQALAGLAGPHPSTWAAVPGTNDQRELDWLGRPTGRVIQGGPMQLDPDKSLYTVPPNDPTHPNFIGGGNAPPPNPANGGPPPPAGGPQPPPAPSDAPGAPGGLGMFPGGMTLPPGAGGAQQPPPPGGAQQPPPPAAPPAGGASSNGEIDPLANVKVAGEDYLSSPAVAQNPKWGPLASQARAILRGQAPYPTGTAGAKPQDQNLIKLLFAADPNFSAAVNSARMGAIQNFSDNTTPGAPGGMILAANTALHHLGALSDSYDQMGNGDYSVINAVRNGVRDVWKDGNPGENNYTFNKNALVDELAKIYKGGTPAQAEIESMAKSLSPNMTRAEFQAIAAKMSTLLQGKTTELQRNWHSLYGANATDYPVLGDEGKATIQRFSGGAPAQGAAGGVHQLNPSDPDGDYARLPSGAKFSGPDGKVRTKP